MRENGKETKGLVDRDASLEPVKGSREGGRKQEREEGKKEGEKTAL
jgi:hypothetical protein